MLSESVGKYAYMLDQQTTETVKHILSQFPQLKNAHVFLFGSRATDKNVKFSDIDLGIQANGPVDARVLFDLEEQLEQSNIPYTVDVVDFHRVSDRFREHALQKIVSLN